MTHVSSRLLRQVAQHLQLPGELQAQVVVGAVEGVDDLLVTDRSRARTRQSRRGGTSRPARPLRAPTSRGSQPRATQARPCPPPAALSARALRRAARPRLDETLCFAFPRAAAGEGAASRAPRRRCSRRRPQAPRRTRSPGSTSTLRPRRGSATPRRRSRSGRAGSTASRSSRSACDRACPTGSLIHRMPETRNDRARARARQPAALKRASRLRDGRLRRAGIDARTGVRAPRCLVSGTSGIAAAASAGRRRSRTPSRRGRSARRRSLRGAARPSA